MHKRSSGKSRRAGGTAAGRAAGGFAAAVALSALVTACSGSTGSAPFGPASPGGPEGGVSAHAGSGSRAKCLGFNGLDGLNPAAEVRAGRFRIPGSAATRVATGTDVDWGLDPFNDRTWQLWLHSLEWLGGAIKEYERTRDPSDLDLAAGIARDWLADNAGPERFDEHRRESISEGTKFRLATLVCLRRYRSGRWLDEAIARHAEWLADPRHYSGPWNHGTDESMILMTAGCGIGRTDLIDTGQRRLLDSMLAPPGGARPAIDEEGANNEQSTHYSVYNRGRWRLAFAVMRQCGRPAPRELLDRHRRMDEFIAFQTTPAGDQLQIGESYAARASDISALGNGPLRYVATGGAKGTPPRERARVYQAGYVMGRSGWGRQGRRFADEMSYTARFGPGRYAHGQNDHMALTFHALGRDIIVPSGHIGYSDPQWNTWLRSPDAHSALVVRGAEFDPKAATELTAHRFLRGADTFRFTDTAFAGTTRSRSVLAASDPDALLVLDDAASAASVPVEQLWHLPAGFTAVPDGTGAVAAAGKVRVHFLQIPLPGTAPLPARITRGSLKPPQGWMVPAPRKTLPAPVVSFPAEGLKVRMLTLIAPVRGEERPQVRTAALPGGGLRVEARFSGRRLTAEAAPDGTLRRLP
ncbi:heparinase II/III family protein [Actinomadura sp. NEAU-AAG7]|uniref:heparinase II/III domain-containing protein n=1 Tax=Actinomadura sp. NEAU-AAG7 TaxID=2839640 RepID=UPI001BE480E8|nr:heparinase II/III family protein [Actinomadura sp. NEAU-AAG7]MBT2211683.1 heparinase II/III family protein [Actinomadura sp. NEAU-AAG7]